MDARQYTKCRGILAFLAQVWIDLNMPLTDLISAEAILPAMKSAGKKQALQDLSEKAALVTGLPDREIFDSIWQRERLGSTGVGNGIAIPHAKLAKCDRIYGIFGRLDRAIDFEALDGAPVDLMFLLLAPEDAGADHLRALARIARVLRDPGFAAKLRASRDAHTIFALLANQPQTYAA